MILNAMINDNNQSLDLNEENTAFHAAKRARYKENVGSQKFKGLVPQQNGHWGAQIYANHQRIWLGTFKSEREAAMAYDSATIKLRNNRDGHRNFPWNDQTCQEPNFQSHYNTKAVLSMIRDGTYSEKFSTFLRTQTQNVKGIETTSCCLKQIIVVNEEEKFYCSQLFQKELTPSDVGKLNRLVIPKKHALKYFPYVCENIENENENNNGIVGGASDIEIVFYDKLMRSWRFRYCYWRSSQSYVFTRGWNRYVKDKKLRAKDIIAFYTCEPTNRAISGETFCLIDVIYYGKEKMHYFEERKSDLKQNLGNSLSYNDVEDEDHNRDHGKNAKESNALQSTKQNGQQKGLKLFGICIE